MFTIRTLRKVKFAGKTIFPIEDIFAHIKAGHKRIKINDKISVNIDLKKIE
mgnify:CR=1 FL=1